ncbi:MAG: TSUP family transporter [Gammaproteobacteria bacterium]|nr:TSUP family transporter [Gammaproteobacteria bacterium]
MEIWQGIVLILVGTIAGFVNVMAAGGSMITVPAMVFMGLPGPVANGTNRIAILAQNITAVTTFFRKGFSDFKLSLSLSLCALPGAIAGAFIGTRLEGVWFNRTLAIIMLIMMVIMSIKKKSASADSPVAGVSRHRLIFGHLLMVLAGLYGGFIQIGIGFILLPILHRVIGLDMVRANMHKVFIIASYTIAALAIFITQVEIAWRLGICLAIGNSIGAWMGAHMAIKKGEGLIKAILNVVLVLFIIKLLFF